jgi:hypothetical protein
LTAAAAPCDVLLVPPSPDQVVAFEALLAEVRRLAGGAADRMEAGLRGIWQGVEDPEAMLREVAMEVRKLRAGRAECDEADGEPGPS